MKIAIQKSKLKYENASRNWQKVDALISMGEIYIELEDHESALNSLYEARQMTDSKSVHRKIEAYVAKCKNKEGEV